jgi:hypothetical protein
VAQHFTDYNSADGLNNNPSLVYGNDRARIAFMAPDAKLHSFDLTQLGPATADTTPPTTAVSSPASGATVSGNTAITASASDNVGVTRVELWVDGALTTSTAAAPYAFFWNTSSARNGSHALQSRAYDAAGNVGSSAIVTVNVNNAVSSLAVTITNPSAGSMVQRNQRVSIDAAVSGAAASRVDFYVDNALLGTDVTAPFNYSWRVPNKKGPHTIKVQAYDPQGNMAAQAISVTAQ